MNQTLMRISVVAWRLSVSESFVYQAINEGRMKFFRLGKGQGGLRVSEQQLQDFLAKQEEGGEPQPETIPPRTVTVKPLKNLTLDS